MFLTRYRSAHIYGIFECGNEISATYNKIFLGSLGGDNADWVRYETIYFWVWWGDNAIWGLYELDKY